MEFVDVRIIRATESWRLVPCLQKKILSSDNLYQRLPVWNSWIRCEWRLSYSEIPKHWKGQEFGWPTKENIRHWVELPKRGDTGVAECMDRDELGCLSPSGRRRRYHLSQSSLVFGLLGFCLALVEYFVAVLVRLLLLWRDMTQETLIREDI